MSLRTRWSSPEQTWLAAVLTETRSSYQNLAAMSAGLSSSSLLSCRDLDARAKNERYRSAFRLTQDERLDGHTDCTLWAPFAKMHVIGQLFISNNYICFSSREEDVCQLIIPLREVSGRERLREDGT